MEVWDKPGQAQTAPFLVPLDSPIWDWATNVEVRSQSGEKGSPSSASLSPWQEKMPQSWEGWGDKWLQWEKGTLLPFDLEMRGEWR